MKKKRSTRTHLLDDLSMLWILGVASALAFLGARFLPFEGERKEWSIYLLLGGALPLSAMVLGSGKVLPPRVSNAAKYGAIGALALLFVTRFLEGLSLSVVVAAIAQAVFVARYWPIRGRHPQGGAAFLAAAFSCAMLWAAASKLIWFSAWDPWISTSAESMAALVLGSVLAAIVANPAERSAAPRPIATAFTITAIAAFLLASTRVDIDVDINFFIGSAELVRQGGWLLWDVPSQYGFLNILLMAIAPLKTVWQSVYAVNSAFLFASGCLVFAILRRLDRSVLGQGWALLMAFATSYLMPGYVHWLLGPNRLPSVGGFRFVWCYALLFITLLCSDAIAEKRTVKRLWITGSATWAIASLWSFESLVFSTLVWAPAYCWMVARREGITRVALKWLALPPAILAAEIAAVTAYYLVRLGHPPDWRAFVEYALAYQGGFGALPIDPSGSVWVLVAVLAACLAILSDSLFRQLKGTEPDAATPLALSGAGMLWATSSYFISRSHENNMSNLAPLFVTSFVAGLLAANRGASFRLSSWIPRLLLVPLTGAIFVATYGNSASIGTYLSSLIAPRSLESIHDVVPTSEDQVVTLYATSGASLAEAVAYHHVRLLPSLAGGGATPTARSTLPRFWLPFAPASQFSILPLDRQRVYIERFVDRNRSGGWLITPRGIFGVGGEKISFGNDVLISPETLRSILGDRFRVARTLDSDQWRMELFEPR